MTRETATLVVSSLTAIALLGAAVTGQPSRTQPDRVTALQSDLRYQLDLRWRGDRAVYATREAALDEVLTAWQKSPQAGSDRELLTAWLHDAIVASLPGESGELPAAPAFGSDKPPATADLRQAALSGSEAQDTEVFPAIAAREQARTGAAPLSSKPKSPAAAGPEIAEAEQVGLTDLNRPKTVAASSTPPVERSITVRKQIANAASARVATTQVRELKDEAAAPGSELHELPAVVVESSTAGVDAVAIATPPANIRPTVSVDKSAIIAKAEPKADRGVTVNLAELNARISGYHEGLAEVEAAIIAAKDRVTARAAESLVSTVEELAGQYQFVRLYYDALSKDERRSVTGPRSMGPIVKLVSQQCGRLENSGDEDVFAPAEGSEGDLAKRLRRVVEALEKK